MQIFLKVLDDQDFDPKLKLNTLEKFDEVLGLNIRGMKEEYVFIPLEIQQLVEKREKARKSRNFAESDALRNIIKERGYLIEDSPEGQKIRKI